MLVDDDGSIPIQSINKGGSYIWKPNTTETIKGNWVHSGNPDYPITVQKGPGGDDWGVTAYGRTGDAPYNLAVRSLGAVAKTFWGPPVGKMASVPPLMAAPENALQAPATRWKKGDKVEYNQGFFWSKGTIVDVDNGRYFIDFDGASSTWNVWASEDKLRPRQ